MSSAHHSHLELARHDPFELLWRGIDLLRLFCRRHGSTLGGTGCPRRSLGFEEGGGGRVDRLGKSKNEFSVHVGNVSVEIEYVSICAN